MTKFGYTERLEEVISAEKNYIQRRRETIADAPQAYWQTYLGSLQKEQKALNEDQGTTSIKRKELLKALIPKIEELIAWDKRLAEIRPKLSKVTGKDKQQLIQEKVMLENKKRERERALLPISTLNHPPVGVAFSGGGSRSATFNLGFAQGLARYRVLPWVDYLTSVSGGGFTAVTLLSLLSAHAENQNADPQTGHRFYFSPHWEAFPLNPNIKVFDPAKLTDVSKENDNYATRSIEPGTNTQLEHLRKMGDFLIPLLGSTTAETLRFVGAVVMGITYTVFLYLLAIFGIAALSFGFTAILSPTVLQPVTLETALEQAATNTPATTNMTVTLGEEEIQLTGTSSDQGSEPVEKTAEDTIPYWTLLRFTFGQTDGTHTVANSSNDEFVTTVAAWHFLTVAIMSFLLNFVVTWYWGSRFIRERLTKNDKGLERFEKLDPWEQGRVGRQYRKGMLYSYSFFNLMTVFVINIGSAFLYPHIKLFSIWLPLFALLGTTFSLLVYRLLKLEYSDITDNQPVSRILWSSPAYRSIYWSVEGVHLYVMLIYVILVLIVVPRMFTNSVTPLFKLDLSLSTITAVITALTVGLGISSSLGKSDNKADSGEGVSKLVATLLTLSWALQKIILGLLVLCLNVLLIADFLSLVRTIVDTLSQIPVTQIWWFYLIIIPLLASVIQMRREAQYGASIPWQRRRLGRWLRDFLLPLLLKTILPILILLSLAMLAIAFGVPGRQVSDVTQMMFLYSAVFAEIGLLLFLMRVVGRYVNFNYLSPHYLFRDRMADAFMKTTIQTEGRTRVAFARDNSQMTLTDVNPNNCSAPYFLVVTAINLAGSWDLRFKDRKSQHFIFSRSYCGAEVTGYVRSRIFRKDYTKLSRAIAISGAAASSSIGYVTFFAQAFVLTLLNLRLGLWLANPKRYKELAELKVKQKRVEKEVNLNLTPQEERRLQALKNGLDELYIENKAFWPYPYLWDELWGWTNERRDMVNVSDGGHTGDNGGLYPLFQRRCKLIIAGDASRDPDFTFNDLFHVLVQVKSDLNIDVDINVAGLKPDDNGLCKFHCAVGIISYPPASSGDKPMTGWLLYFKPTLLGDESDFLKHYREIHEKKFPHVDTTDLFFDEEQFEAYRQIGEKSVKRTLQHLADYYKQQAEETKQQAGKVAGSMSQAEKKWRTLAQKYEQFKAKEHRIQLWQEQQMLPWDIIFDDTDQFFKDLQKATTPAEMETAVPKT